MKAAEAPPTVAALAESAELILSQAARASLAARQLAEAAAPHPGPPDWIDLNAVVRRVVQLNGYDRRYRQLQFESRLDADLPALRVSADALQQVLMQLVSLGCEALAAEGRAATVRVHTARDDAAVVIGLEVPVQVELQRVEVQRRLSLCRAVVEAMKAQLDLAQDDGPVWRVTLKLKPGERVGPG
jgi:signal transduction histidine kinase